MKDVKIGNIRPLAEPRSPERVVRKEPLKGPDFSHTLKNVLNEIQQQQQGTAAASDTKAVLDGLAAQNKLTNDMRRVELELRAEYERQQKSTRDEG